MIAGEFSAFRIVQNHLHPPPISKGDFFALCRSRAQRFMTSSRSSSVTLTIALAVSLIA